MIAHRNASLLLLAALASSCATSREQGEPSRTDGGTDASSTTDQTTTAAETSGAETTRVTDNSSTDNVGVSAETALDAGPRGADLTGTPCEEPLTCVGLVGYYCEDLDAWNEGEDVTPTWVLDPTLTCPILSEEECWDIEAELGALVAADNSCQSDTDCEILGGVDPDQACDCTPFLSAHAYSLQADYTPIRELYNRLVDGSCAEAICDAAPQEVACIQGSCELVGADSCLDFIGDEDPPDGGAVDAGIDAGAVDAGPPDAG